MPLAKNLNWKQAVSNIGKIDLAISVTAVDMRGNPTSMIFEGITESTMSQGFARYNQGALIQNAFPFLTLDQREFLMTGMTPEAWDQGMGGDE